MAWKYLKYNDKLLRRGDELLRAIPLVKAEGGTVYEIGGYIIHAFTEDGIFNVYHSFDASILVVAGGGCGGTDFYGKVLGDRSSGGGGGGGYRFEPNYSLTQKSYDVSVGKGGQPVSLQPLGSNGEDSIFDMLVAFGGGGGSGHWGKNTGTRGPGGDGGSGGGAWHEDQIGNPLAAPGKGYVGPPRQGYDGGKVVISNARAGSGGGGATQIGGSPTATNVPGIGGDGIYFGDTFGDIFGDDGWFCGGGGGKSWTRVVGANGKGSGAVANSGGGGTARGRDVMGDPGSDGIILIKYKA